MQHRKLVPPDVMTMTIQIEGQGTDFSRNAMLTMNSYNLGFLIS